MPGSMKDLYDKLGDGYVASLKDKLMAYPFAETFAGPPEDHLGGPVEFYMPAAAIGVEPKTCHAMRWAAAEDRQLAIRAWLATIGQRLQAEKFIDPTCLWQIVGEVYFSKNDATMVEIQHVKTGEKFKTSMSQYVHKFATSKLVLRWAATCSSDTVIHYTSLFEPHLPIVEFGDWIAIPDNKAMAAVIGHDEFVAKWKPKPKYPAEVQYPAEDPLDFKTWFATDSVPQKWLMGASPGIIESPPNSSLGPVNTKDPCDPCANCGKYYKHHFGGHCGPSIEDGMFYPVAKKVTDLCANCKKTWGMHFGMNCHPGGQPSGTFLLTNLKLTDVCAICGGSFKYHFGMNCNPAEYGNDTFVLEKPVTKIDDDDLWPDDDHYDDVGPF